MKVEMTTGQPQRDCGSKPRIPTAALPIVCADSASSRPYRAKSKLSMKANVKPRVITYWAPKSLARVSPSSRYTASLRVPASPDNWAYLRDLRRAELEAWNASRQTAKAGEHTTVAQGLIRISRGSQDESRLLIGIALVAMAAVGYGLWSSTQVVEHWAQFVNFVSQLLA